MRVAALNGSICGPTIDPNPDIGAKETTPACGTLATQ